MKRSLNLLMLFPAASVAVAAVGSHVDTSFYVADGVVLDQQTDGTLVPNRVESTRFYDSTKGAEWVTSLKSDSLMCWAHAAANSIQYWQSYYGVFAKPQQGIYFTDNGTQEGSLYPQTSFNEMPLPYGNIGTETTTVLGDNGMYEDTQYNVPDPKRLDVARDLYCNIAENMGGTVKAATEWFFRGQTDLQGDNGFYFNSQYTGGYYKNYYEPLPQDTNAYTQPQNLNGLAYTTVYSETIEILGNNNSTTGSPFKNTDLNAVKNLILKGFGIENGKQAQSGLLPLIGLWNDVGTGHFITCYGFTTDSDGNLESILIADSDDNITGASNISQRYVAIENEKIVLYTDKNLSSRWGSYYIGEVSYINTPQVLQNMLAEYRDVSNEAQVWNGHSGVWEQQTATTEALPTESTGWDIHVNGSNIDSEHHGYYHTYATDGRAVLFDDHAEEANRKITINGTVSARLIEVAATGYEFIAGKNAALAAGADMLIRQAATLHSDLALNLANLTLEVGASLSSSSETIVVTGTFMASLQAATTFSLKNAVTVPARVNAHLDLSAAKQIILETSVSLNDYTLTLAEGQTITLSSVDENLPFFTDIGKLIIDGEQIAEGTDLGEYLVFISPDNEEYTNISFIYQNNSILAASILAASIPEPTTATLSLLALAALATRRRRAAAKASA